MARSKTPAQKFGDKLAKLVQKFPLKIRKEWVRYLGYGATVVFAAADVLADGFQVADLTAVAVAVGLVESARAGVKPAHRK